jgi:hypothetical protein
VKIRQHKLAVKVLVSVEPVPGERAVWARHSGGLAKVTETMATSGTPQEFVDAVRAAVDWSETPCES